MITLRLWHNLFFFISFLFSIFFCFFFCAVIALISAHTHRIRISKQRTRCDELKNYKKKRIVNKFIFYANRSKKKEINMKKKNPRNLTTKAKIPVRLICEHLSFVSTASCRFHLRNSNENWPQTQYSVEWNAEFEEKNGKKRKKTEQIITFRFATSRIQSIVSFF